MDQLFFIGMTMTGFGWHDLMSLPDMDRIALLLRCQDYQDQQRGELNAMRAKA